MNQTRPRFNRRSVLACAAASVTGILLRGAPAWALIEAEFQQPQSN